MNILLFGATGMVGDGVLRWLIASHKVNRVVAVSRRPLSVQHPKLETVIEARHVAAAASESPSVGCVLLLSRRQLRRA
jgi:uncharacterized protein YbjT (DUF2867 family)